MSTPPSLGSTIGANIDQLLGTSAKKIDPVEDQNAFIKSVDFIRRHPSLFTTGIPPIFITYISLPLLAMIFYWLPWIWAGYSVYSKIPPGTGLALWSAIQASKMIA